MDMMNTKNIFLSLIKSAIKVSNKPTPYSSIFQPNNATGIYFKKGRRHSRLNCSCILSCRFCFLTVIGLASQVVMNNCVGNMDMGICLEAGLFQKICFVYFF